MKTAKNMMPKGLTKTVKGEMKPTRMKPVGAKQPSKAPTTKGKK